jgi:hypothetical protein
MTRADDKILTRLRVRMRLPWRVRPPGGSAVHLGVRDGSGLAVLSVGRIQARTAEQQAEMVRFAVVAANALPRLLAHCQALERQLGQAGLELEHAGVADEILAQLELAGWADEGAPAWRA